jgi:GNAT superfamily N-acetyltransferase
MTTFTYRALENVDLEVAGRLLVESYPYREHEPSSWTRPSPKEQPRRWGASRPSSFGDRPSAVEMVGYAAIWRVEGEKFRFDVVVSPRYVRNGLGGGLFDIVTHEAQEAGAATLQARACLTNVEPLAFLARRKFVETMRMHGFVLDLTTVGTDVLIGAAAAALPAEVSIASVTKLQTGDPGFWSKLADLQDGAREGWPDPDPGGPFTPTQPTELRSMLMPSGEMPVAFFVASRQDRFVWYSAVIRRRAINEAQFWATAVRPEDRGQGLAMALRARCLAVAWAPGYARVRSTSGSDALIRINRRFGFQETYCEVRLRRLT